MTTGWILKTDGTYQEVSNKLPEEGNTNLSALYEALDCTYVEVVPFSQGELWCDEEGLLKAKHQVNELATRIWNQPGSPQVFPINELNTVIWNEARQLVGTVYMRLNAGYTVQGGSVVKAP